MKVIIFLFSYRHLSNGSIFQIVFLYFSRFLPYLIPEDPNSEEGESGPDLSTLRTFRVLRPLKLVSGVPSKLRATVAYNCPPVAVKYM